MLRYELKCCQLYLGPIHNSLLYWDMLVRLGVSGGSMSFESDHGAVAPPLLFVGVCIPVQQAAEFHADTCMVSLLLHGHVLVKHV